jgi:hypothetical protein
MHFRFSYIIAQPRDRKCDFCKAADRAHRAEENGILQARIACGIAKIQGVGGNHPWVGDNHPPLGSGCRKKKLGSLKVNRVTLAQLLLELPHLFFSFFFWCAYTFLISFFLVLLARINNKKISTIKSHIKNCKYQFLLILEMVSHVTWNGVSVTPNS